MGLIHNDRVRPGMSPGGIGLALLVVVLALLAGCTGARYAPAPDDRWLEIDTEHFRIHTNVPERRARDLSQSLEEIRAGLLEVAWAGQPPPRGRTEVAIFATPAALQFYLGSSVRVGAAYQQAGQEPLLSFAPDGNAVPDVAVHEIAHDLGRWYMPVQPTWLSEGLAMYLETFRHDRALRVATVGGLSEESRAYLHATRLVIDSEDVFSRERPIAEDLRGSSSFHASSWLIVHYLINRHSQAFGRFQRDLAQLRDWRSSWREHLGILTPARLNAELIRYAKSARFQVLRKDLRRIEQRPSVRQLTAAEAHARLAWTALRMHNDSMAWRELQIALDLNENEFFAQLTRFHLALEAGERATALDAAKRAIEHSDGVETWLLVANLSHDDKRPEAIQRASQKAPDHPGVRGQLAQLAAERGDWKGAVDHAQVSLRRAGPTLSNLILLVRAYGALGDCRAAHDIAEAARRRYGVECETPFDVGDVRCGRDLEQALAERCAG